MCQEGQEEEMLRSGEAGCSPVTCCHFARVALTTFTVFDLASGGSPFIGGNLFVHSSNLSIQFGKY